MRGSFHDPSSGYDGEALLTMRFAYDVHGGFEYPDGPVDELAAKGAVGEHEPDRGGQVHAEQYGFGAVLVVHAGGDHTDRDKQTKVSVTMNRFRPLTRLPAS